MLSQNNAYLHFILSQKNDLCYNECIMENTKQSKNPFKKSSVQSILLLLLILCITAVSVIVIQKLYPDKRSYKTSELPEGPGDRLVDSTPYTLRRIPMADLAEGSYNSMMLPMYEAGPLEQYAEMLYTFQLLLPYTPSHPATRLRLIEDYTQKAAETEQELTALFLWMDPYSLWKWSGRDTGMLETRIADAIRPVLERDPELHIAVSYPCYSLDSLCENTEVDPEDLAESYIALTKILGEYDGLQIFYYGCEEWAIRNPANFADGSGKILNDLFYEDMAKNTFMGGGRYIVSSETIEEKMDALTSLIKRKRDGFLADPDLSGKQIFFVGDSVFGNFRNCTSIPAAAEGLSGATCYNLGIGGMTASGVDDSSGLWGMLSYIFGEGSMEPQYEDFDLAREALSSMTTQDSPIFVLEFGLNDYFGGMAAENPDAPMDNNTYAGALRNGIRLIREHFPNARILLLSPGYTGLFNNGLEFASDGPHNLPIFRQTAMKVAEENEVDCLDLTSDFAFTAENFTDYIWDAVHYNERGRYEIAKTITEYLGK